MGNYQGKQVSKREILSMLSNTQRGYVESWFGTICEEETRVIHKTVFEEDMRKRFTNMPYCIISALFQCMDPDSKECVSENAFFYLSYIILNGSFEELLELTYNLLQNIDKSSEVTIRSVLLLFKYVNTKSDEDLEWKEEKLLDALDCNLSDPIDTVISFEQFSHFGKKYPNSPIIQWASRFRQLIQDCCLLRQELADKQDTSNSKLSKLFHTNRNNLLYSRLRDMSLSVLMEIYGILRRSSNQGIISRAQWLTEMSRFFSQDLIISVFNEFSKDSEHLNLYVTVSALCLLCHDPVDQRIKAALYIFQYSLKSVDLFTHGDLVQLLMAGLTMFGIDNSFEYECDSDDSDDNHIHIKRRLSQDDSSHYSNVVSFVDTIFMDYQKNKPLYQRAISSSEIMEWILQHPNHYSYLTHQLRPDYDTPADHDDELREYKRLYKEYNPETVEANELYYVISKTWWSSWIQYINSNCDTEKVLHVKRPERINNSMLLEEDHFRLRSDLTEKKEYMIITEPLWMALSNWYGGGPTISRRVIRSGSHKPELELYPLLLHICLCSEDGIPEEPTEKLLSSKVQTVERVKKRICQIFGFPTGRCRLWLIESDRDDSVWLKDESQTLEELELCEEPLVMVEQMNENGKWVYGISNNKRSHKNVGVPGLVGLENLGNTCYMNCALQCLSHTALFKDYFLSESYLDDINTDSPDGLNGEFAHAFGVLMNSIWNSPHRVVAPRRFKNSLVELKPQFQGFIQHDAQELLSVVLDGLNEDLNLSKVKPYVGIDGNCEDSELARRCWKLHCCRECSIITALFYGQFRTYSQCTACSHHSSHFEPFSILQLPLPETEMKALSLTISYSNGRVPVQCSIRIPADSIIGDVKFALNELDSSFNLNENRIQLAKVVNSNVYEVYDPTDRLTVCSTSDLTAFVLPPEDEFLGIHGYYQYLKKYKPKSLSENQHVRLKMIGENGLPLTGVIRELYTDFCFSVHCSDGKTRKALITDLEDCEEYMLHPGDYVFLIINKKDSKYEMGVYNGPSLKDPSLCSIRLFPSERDIDVSIDRVCRRNPRRHKIYLVQRYLGINDDYYLGYATPIMVGVPQAIDIMPEFVTGRQLYNYIHKHFQATISNPITQTAMDVISSKDTNKPRLSRIPADLSHASSVHLNHPLCSSFIDTDSSLLQLSPSYESPLFSSDDEEEEKHRLNRRRSIRSDKGIEDELKWGYMKEEEIQSCINQHYGFVLKLVDPAGTACAACHWLKGCTGCAIIPDDTPLNCLVVSRKIAIDWDQAYLSEHYHQIMYDNTITHSSVDSSEIAGKQSILLQECFQRFVQTELLEQEQKLKCDDCGVFTNHYLSTHIWRAPPILIIHLKRFQLSTHGYIKIQSNVEYPVTDLDLADFLVNERVEVGKADTHVWELLGGKKNQSTENDSTIQSSNTISKEEEEWKAFEEKYPVTPIPEKRSTCTKYDLYGVVLHTGTMEGGHYKSIIQASDEKWYLINDSQYRPIPVSEVVNSNAYILFYVRQDVRSEDYHQYFKTVVEKEVKVEENAEKEVNAVIVENEEAKKKCTIL